MIGHAVGRSKVRKVHAPLAVVKVATRALQWLPAYPVSQDQLTMLEEESVVPDPQRFFGDFGLTSEPLIAGLRRMLTSR